MASSIFHDPSGQRARRAGLVLALVLSGILAVIAAFFMTLATAPRLPDMKLRDPRVLSAVHRENVLSLKTKPGWTRVPHPRMATRGGQAKPLTVGFYVSWDEQSRHSLTAHLAQLDVVAPQWIALEDAKGAIRLTEDPQATAMIAAAEHRPSVLPVLFNAKNMAFNGEMADRFLADPAARKRM
ncbi:MAG: polysaccharide deacetylase, partial [Caulobacteraceae bacterium]|nr:polysaccharide deacetylase [Caulobacteraceae bacterium]